MPSNPLVLWKQACLNAYSSGTGYQLHLQYTYPFKDSHRASFGIDIQSPAVICVDQLPIPGVAGAAAPEFCTPISIALPIYGSCIQVTLVFDHVHVCPDTS